jgi:hypothetical protein
LQKFAEEGAAFRAEQQVNHANDIEYIIKVDAETDKSEEELNVKSTNPLNAIQAYENQRDVE